MNKKPPLTEGDWRGGIKDAGDNKKPIAPPPSGTPLDVDTEHMIKTINV